MWQLPPDRWLRVHSAMPHEWDARSLRDKYYLLHTISPNGRSSSRPGTATSARKNNQHPSSAKRVKIQPEKPVAEQHLSQHAAGRLASKLGTDQPRGSQAMSKSDTPARRPDGWRETVESVVVAFVLAFLFRTFEAEAFVIPTGSMAPTLYGQHRDVYCEQCGTRFAVGVSSGTAGDAEIRNGYVVPHARSNYAICPNANCRFPNNVLDREIFAGDRILVNKFPYEFSEPKRWDVVVFKFPEGAKTNYIKRLVGLPGEDIKLEGGDVKVRKRGEQEFRVARKPPEKQRLLQLLVHDNDRPARDLLAAGWPEAWASDQRAGSKWSADAQARAFRCDPDELAGDLWQWLRYTNYAPRAADWSRALGSTASASLGRPQPEAVRDFYGYNSRITLGEAEGAASRGDLPDLLGDNGAEWVGDLTLTCTLEAFAAEGEIVFELVESPRRYRCQINLKSGQGALSYQDEPARAGEDFKPAGEPFDSGISRAGSYDISFANVDDRLCLWIDGKLVKSLEFEIDSRYPPPDPAAVRPGQADWSPVAIAARKAKVRVSHLLIERDTYYRNELPPGVQIDRDGIYALNDDDDDDFEDQFLMLGDNSPKSNDSRLWNSGHAVSRRLLIGKAFFIYWPHGVPFMNGGRGFAVANYYERPDAAGRQRPPIPKFSLPFYPQVGRMHRIR